MSTAHYQPDSDNGLLRGQVVGELLAEGEKELRLAGVKNPSIDVQWLMAATLNCARTELALRLREPLRKEQRQLWGKYLSQRQRRIPLQYILGKVPFANLTLLVDSRALVPRPETEELVILLMEHFCQKPPRHILDLGTGSGACILALGVAFPTATLTACDVDGQALALARANGIRCGLDKRVRWQRSNWFSQLTGTWDLIIANPPYLSKEEWKACADEVRLFEPFRALVSADGGLADGQHILADGKRFLRSGGLLAMEIGSSQGTALRTFAERQDWQEVWVVQDLSGRDRFLFATRSDKSFFQGPTC